MDSLIVSILLSMSPVSELRGGIPYALSQGFSVSNAYILCVTANIVAAAIIMVFLTYLHSFFMNYKFYQKIFNFFLKRAQQRSKKLESQMGAWGYVALCIFVAIPLPMTGAWTGTLIAWILGLNKLKSIAAIAIGVAIAGVIVTLVSLGAIGFLGFIL